MRLRKQEHIVDCVPAAFYMVLAQSIEQRYNQKLDWLTYAECIGVEEGHEILWPDRPSPQCFRTVHPMSITEYALMVWNVSFVSFIFPDWMGYDQESAVPVNPMHTADELTKERDAVIIGEKGSMSHAVAWDHREKKFYDPAGFVMDSSPIICHYLFVMG